MGSFFYWPSHGGFSDQKLVDLSEKVLTHIKDA